LVLSWPASTDNLADPRDLQYAVYLSEYGNIDTVANCENNGTLIVDYTTGIFTTNVGNLRPDSFSYLNVVVRDPAGNTSCYFMDMATTSQTEAEKLNGDGTNSNPNETAN
jgi:hypothetical protein